MIGDRRRPKSASLVQATENGVNRMKCASAIAAPVTCRPIILAVQPMKQIPSAARISMNGIPPNFTSSGRYLNGSSNESFTIEKTGSSITVNRR